MITTPCPANEILQREFDRLSRSRMPDSDAHDLVVKAEGFRELLLIDAGDLAYWERSAKLAAQFRRQHLRFQSQQKSIGAAA